MRRKWHFIADDLGLEGFTDWLVRIDWSDVDNYLRLAAEFQERYPE